MHPHGVAALLQCFRREELQRWDAVVAGQLAAVRAELQRRNSAGVLGDVTAAGGGGEASAAARFGRNGDPRVAAAARSWFQLGVGSSGASASSQVLSASSVASTAMSESTTVEEVEGDDDEGGGDEGSGDAGKEESDPQTRVARLSASITMRQRRSVVAAAAIVGGGRGASWR